MHTCILIYIYVHREHAEREVNVCKGCWLNKVIQNAFKLH